MTNSRTGVVARCEASTADFCARTVLKHQLIMGIRLSATATLTRAAMPTSQVRFARCRADKTCRSDITPALNLYDMSAVWNPFLNKNIALDRACILRLIT